ncbi:MAG: hypothetical protein HW401_194 [Parcubacteria group bacterium]|nr:hypothetical protein [Parcubacteria group bacterium]
MSDKNKILAPIALFVYNRPEHTRKTVEALQKNLLAKESELFIFSDGPKNESDSIKVQEVRNYLKTISGFKSVKIIERDKNLGLANSIISGVTDIVNRFGRIIVLEDDMISSPYFLRFMNEALDLYGNEEKVISIHAYTYPTKQKLPETFFLKGADCWGWATWKRGWDMFESDGQKLLDELQKRKLTREFDYNNSYRFSETLHKQAQGMKDSWAIRWYASAFLSDRLTLYPGKSLIKNIGFDGSGVHSGFSNIYDIKNLGMNISLKMIETTEDKKSKKAIEKYFRSVNMKILKRLFWKISSLRKLIFGAN